MAAVAGAGRMGLRHLEALDTFELVGVADQRRAALAALPGSYGLSDGLLFDSAARMLESVVPDLFVVATTANAHCELVIAAARAGVPFILVEKPMAQSLDECHEMIDACSEHGARLAVNHQRRYFDIYAFVRNVVQSGRIGGLSSMTVAGANFGLAMNGIHYFEEFAFLSGQAPAAVTAWLSSMGVSNPRGTEFEDWAGEIRVRADQGALLHLAAPADQGHGTICTYSGPYGQVIVDELSNSVWVNSRKPEHRGQPSSRYAMPSDRTQKAFPDPSLIAATRCLVDDLVHGRSAPSPADGASAVAVLTAAIQSNSDGHRAVAVDESLASIHLPVA